MLRQHKWTDSGPAGSFFATLKTEPIHHWRFATRAEAATVIFRYIELFYNPHRLHSTLRYLSPMQFGGLTQTKKRRLTQTVHASREVHLIAWHGYEPRARLYQIG